jgi:hypothetical protein
VLIKGAEIVGSCFVPRTCQIACSRRSETLARLTLAFAEGPLWLIQSLRKKLAGHTNPAFPC